jgi:hypothetical protein
MIGIRLLPLGYLPAERGLSQYAAACSPLLRRFSALTLMLTFKLLIINNVALWKSLLTSVLTFNLLAINSVALVELYMRLYQMTRLLGKVLEIESTVR